MTIHHVRIDLGYHGRDFFGSQRQAVGRTVQSELERALEQVSGVRSKVALAGRTDRGVHAVGQVASATVNWDKDLERLRFAIDSVTDDDLVVYDVRPVDENFHARFSARQREYRYRVFASDRAPVLIRDHVWWVRERSELRLMNQASELLTGEIDFRSFAGKGIGSNAAIENTIRIVDLAEWRTITTHLERFGKIFEFRIRANAFLPHMVRNLTGALLEVGLGAKSIDWLHELIEARDRTKAPPPAPPHGLTLWRVMYADETFEQEPGTSAGLEQE